MLIKLIMGTFAFLTVSFGDGPAASFLEIAIRRTSKMNQAVDPVAKARIRDDPYVHDISTGGTPEEVAHFKGNEGYYLKVLTNWYQLVDLIH